MFSKSFTFSGSFRLHRLNGEPLQTGGGAATLQYHERVSHDWHPVPVGGDISTLEKGDITTLR